MPSEKNKTWNDGEKEWERKDREQKRAGVKRRLAKSGIEKLTQSLGEFYLDLGGLRTEMVLWLQAVFQALLMCACVRARPCMHARIKFYMQTSTDKRPALKNDSTGTLLRFAFFSQMMWWTPWLAALNTSGVSFTEREHAKWAVTMPT